MELLKRLWDGDVSLAKTFWIYGVATTFLIKFMTLSQLASATISPLVVLSTGFLLAIVIMFYGIHYPIALFNAAKQYTGAIVWKNLSYIVAGIYLLVYPIVVLGFFTLQLPKLITIFFQ